MPASDTARNRLAGLTWQCLENFLSKQQMKLKLNSKWARREAEAAAEQLDSWENSWELRRTGKESLLTMMGLTFRELS